MDLPEALAIVEGLEYELRKQRAVFLRIMYSPGCIFPSGPEGATRLIETEERFRAEFDAIHALMLLVRIPEEM